MYGCHSDRRSGEYHCHRGEYSGLVFRSKSEMLTQKEAGRSGAALMAEQGGQKQPDSTLLGPILGVEDSGQRSVESSETVIPQGVQRRLDILEDLRKQGLITEQEYAEKRTRLLGPS